MPTSSAATVRPDPDAFFRSLVEAASARYRGSGGHAHRFARAKLANDRVFRHALATGLIRPGAHVVDAGCGQGLLASLLQAAGNAAERGRWPDAWAPAPTGVRVTGIDPMPLSIERAAAAVGDAATFVRADMRTFEFPRCDTAIFFDTLHYISRAEQDAVLRRARDALRPGGTMLLRVHDGDAPVRFALGLWVDRVTMLLHGGGFGRVAGRRPAAWRATLEALGLGVEALPMNGRPPFANLLFVARLPAAARVG